MDHFPVHSELPCLGIYLHLLIFRGYDALYQGLTETVVDVGDYHVSVPDRELAEQSENTVSLDISRLHGGTVHGEHLYEQGEYDDTDDYREHSGIHPFRDRYFGLSPLLFHKVHLLSVL